MSFATRQMQKKKLNGMQCAGNERIVKDGFKWRRGFVKEKDEKGTRGGDGGEAAIQWTQQTQQTQPSTQGHVDGARSESAVFVFSAREAYTPHSRGYTQNRAQDAGGGPGVRWLDAVEERRV